MSPSQPKRPHVLMLHHSHVALREFLLLAEAMIADGRYQPVLIDADNWSAILEESAPAGLQIHRTYRVRPPKAGNASAKKRVSQRQLQHGSGKRSFLGALKNAIKILKGSSQQWSLGAILSVRGTKGLFRKNLQLAREIFDRYAPATLLIYNDRDLKLVPPFLKIAQQRSCPVITVPTAHTGDPNDVVVTHVRKGRNECLWKGGKQRLLKRWIMKHFPAQVFTSPEHGRALFFTPVDIIVLHAFGVLPQNPWVMGGGLSDVVAVSGEEDFGRYQRLGVPVDKVKVTGQVSLDQLHLAVPQRGRLRNTLLSRHHLDPQRKLIIYTPPTLLEIRFVNEQTHRQIHEGIARSLLQTGHNIFVSLHPRSKLADYDFLPNCGAHLLDMPLRELLPAADLFVASYSTTVNWAILLGLPTIIVDFNWFNYAIYSSYRGVRVSRNDHELATILREVLDNAAYYEELRLAQLADAVRVAPFDGQANRRLIDLIQSCRSLKVA